ncbi:MAG: alpha/beta fold hydrolase, partial [Pseudomonadota bacterium]
MATKKRTFVLVHGAWHGGWCWRLVADALRAQGHIVYTPTLTGMGEREHLGTAQTGLTTHIEDVLAVLKYEELSDVVLVGHSYGGPVCQGVYDAAADNISKLIMLDAVVRENGTSMTSTAPPELIEKT